MDYPYGHVGHHHRHNHRDDDDDPTPPPFTHSPFPPPPPHVNHTYPPPPPPHQTYPPPHSYGGAYNPPPPPSSFHSSPAQPPPHSYGGAYNPPPPHVESQFYPPTPQQPSYSHHSSSHESGGSYGGAYNPPPSHVESQFYPPTPQQPSYSHHGGPEDHNNSTHTYSGGPELGLGHLANRPSHKIHCKAGGERFVFGIRDGKVVLTHPDSSDLTQHWYKDEKYSTKVKDKDGHPSFMLVNKGTGQAVKHSVSCHPVQLAPYKPDVLDESVLWTESKDLGSGFRTIRTVNNVHLVMDAWNADKDHGGIHDGTVIALYETWKGDNQNQQWKFVRHCKSVSPSSESNC